MAATIRAHGLGKRYRIGGSRGSLPTLRDQIVSGARRFVSREPRAPREDIWALRDASFEVEQGTTFGIIGPNGAGKSTLLKILSRVTDPSEGYAEIDGSMGSLLEIGTGFHLELTGRENVYFSGAVLGMSRRQIDQRFEGIIAFAELERFVDTPVKWYSSGMLVRLGFAVAAHLEADILLVDEVLAVGDAAFQRKCLSKTRDVVREGRTVCIVSHQLGLISTVCDRAILLNRGTVTAEGKGEDVVGEYLQMIEATAVGSRIAYPVEPEKPLQLRTVAVSGSGGETSRFDVFEQLTLDVTYEVRQPSDGIVLHVLVRRNGEPLFLTFDSDSNPELLATRTPGTYSASVRLPSPLKAGFYAVEVSLYRMNVEGVDTRLHAIDFWVEQISFDPGRHSAASHRLGVMATDLDWKTERIGPPEVNLEDR